MQLFTKAQRDRLIANFRRNQQNTAETDHWPVVKLFTPDAQATWLISEYDPLEELLFGLCDLGLGYPELGHVGRTEVEQLRGPLGLPVERDRHWQADGPLSAYAKAAGPAGGIVELQTGAKQ